MVPDARDLVWKSTSASGSLSHFSATTLPCWLRRAVRNRHRHATEQASRRWRGGRTRRKFDFHTGAIYFAVSSLSTAGLQGIPLASKDWQYAFVGFWCLVGVPLFAAGINLRGNHILGAPRHRRDPRDHVC